jgi:hypothetical protein
MTTLNMGQIRGQGDHLYSDQVGAFCGSEPAHAEPQEESHDGAG